MKSIVLLVAAALVAVAQPVSSQDAASGVRTIIVSGVGRSEAAPNTFRMEADLLGRGITQDEAVAELVRLQSRVSDAVKDLQGLDSLNLTTGLPAVAAVYASDCQAARYPRGANDCAITGYAATSSLTLIAMPAERGGDAVSSAAESGAPNARVQSVYLDDDKALRDQAARAAFDDARRQAQAIASASGQTLGAPLRIADPQSVMSESTVTDYLATVPSLSNSVVAGTPIVFVPGPTRIERRLTVTFAVE